jgi:hypothetical protein
MDDNGGYVWTSAQIEEKRREIFAALNEVRMDLRHLHTRNAQVYDHDRHVQIRRALWECESACDALTHARRNVEQVAP